MGDFVLCCGDVLMLDVSHYPPVGEGVVLGVVT